MLAIRLTCVYMSIYVLTVIITSEPKELIYSKEKISWRAAVNKCETKAGWTLPGQEDTTLVSQGLKKKGWKSVWTGIKRVNFYNFYWEDGSILTEKEVGGKVKFRNIMKKESNPLCMAIESDLHVFEQMSCYTIAVFGICIIENCVCPQKHCIPRGTACYMWPERSMSWFSSRDWCLRKGGHLMNKSNIKQYVPPYSVTAHTYYWIGLRQADWFYYKRTTQDNRAAALELWGDYELSERDECVVINGSVWQSSSCESKQSVICVASYTNEDFVNGISIQNITATAVPSLADSFTQTPRQMNTDVYNSRLVVICLSVGGGILMFIAMICLMYRLAIKYTQPNRNNGIHEYADVFMSEQIEIPARRSPSNRPPALIPQDINLSSVTNQDVGLQQSTQDTRISHVNPDTMYSTPLTEEDIFTMVMKCVRKQLGETAKLGASNKRSVIRSAAKCVIEDYLEPVIDESGSGQIVLKQGKRNEENPAAFKEQRTVKDQPDCSFTEREVEEARQILSQILNEIFHIENRSDISMLSTHC